MTTEPKPKYLLTQGATKLGEIEFLKNLAKQVEPGTYLSSLFSEGLIEWVSFQIIHNDYPPDLFAKYCHIQEENSKHYGQLGSAQKELADAYKALKYVQQELGDEARRHELAVAQLTGQIEELQKQAQAGSNDLYDTQDRARKLSADADRLYERVEELEREVLRQKALRLDLIDELEAEARRKNSDS